jgi:hypothetical protein
MSKERVLKVFALREKGMITESEMWQEILEISVYALNAPADTNLGVNEGIAR